MSIETRAWRQHSANHYTSKNVKIA
jgi:hypothetical protein